MLTIFLSVLLAATPNTVGTTAAQADTVKNISAGGNVNTDVAATNNPAETDFIFYVDEVRVDKETAKKIKLIDIKTITTVRDQAAIDLYGPDAINGVVDIKTKNWNKENKQPVISNSSKKSLEYVDLGLSVNWATCNIGAERPEEYGDYYSWGEIEPKRSYAWDNYIHSNGSNKKLTKYCSDSSYGDKGFTDNKTSLDPEDDVAHIKLGKGWRIPTREEFEELMQNCTWTWNTLNGVNGYLVTSNKSGYTDRSIFLPASGLRSLSNLFFVGQYGFYWSTTTSNNFPDSAVSLYIFYGHLSIIESSAYCQGQCIRPVYTK